MQEIREHQEVAQLNKSEVTMLRERVQELEEVIRQSKKLQNLGKLASGIAHDFNNLLTGVLGSADLMLAKLPPDSPVLDHVKEVVTAARRATSLTQQMMAYAGDGDLAIEPFGMSEGLEAMAHLIGASISDKITLSYDLEPNLPSIQADLEKMLQVVINLVNNASEALGENGGIIFITTGVMECDRSYLSQTYSDGNLREGYYVFLEIADTGAGMDRETLEKVLDPSFTTKSAERGLGLAAVLSIVQTHRGALRIYSEPGEGTVVKALFPSSEQQLSMAGDADSESDDWRGKGTILIIDDEETLRNVAGDILSLSGFNVLKAADGFEGVELFRKKKDEITAVLLDLTMPCMGGRETFDEIRSIEDSACIILTSGYNKQMATDSFNGDDLAGFIQKPFVLKSLRAEIRRVLEK